MDLPTGFQNVWNAALGGRAMTADEESLWSDYFATHGTDKDGLGGVQDYVDIIWGSPEAAQHAASLGADYSKPALHQDTMQARNTQLAQEFFGSPNEPANQTPINIRNMARQAADDIYNNDVSVASNKNVYVPGNDGIVQLNPWAEDYNEVNARGWISSNANNSATSQLLSMIPQVGRHIQFDQSKLADAQRLYEQGTTEPGEMSGQWETSAPAGNGRRAPTYDTFLGALNNLFSQNSAPGMDETGLFDAPSLDLGEEFSAWAGDQSDIYDSLDQFMEQFNSTDTDWMDWGSLPNATGGSEIAPALYGDDFNTFDNMSAGARQNDFSGLWSV